MTAEAPPSLLSEPVELDDGLDDEGPVSPLLPPDDRLWRHPSELQASGARIPGATVGTHPGNRGEGWPASRVWAVAIVAGVVGALTASGVGMLSGALDQRTTVVRSVSQEGPSLTLASDSGTTPAVDWTAVDDAVAPSVVAIKVNGASGTATGSGVLMVDGDTSSYVATDSSLVQNGGTIDVSYISGETVVGRLVRSDPVSGLALVAVPVRHGMFPAFGTAAELQVANPVLAVGARTSPGGSVFSGWVSGEDREVDVSSGLSMQNMIAVTSAQIPVSAAGGPRVDSHGRVVGVTVSLDPTDPTDQGLTFAVPIDMARMICQEMLAHTSINHPWLGVTDAIDLSSAVANELRVSGGTQVGGIWPGSPASRVGLSPSDIIISFDGVPVTSTGALTRLLAGSPLGKVVTISYIHGGSQKSATVVVANQPGDDASR